MDIISEKSRARGRGSHLALYLGCHAVHQLLEVHYSPLYGVIVENATCINHIWYYSHMQVGFPTKLLLVPFQQTKCILNDAPAVAVAPV
jgi:hypothetical protein